jgi:hypothetical protein
MEIQAYLQCFLSLGGIDAAQLDQSPESRVVEIVDVT